jgi:hypothetical protein
MEAFKPPEYTPWLESMLPSFEQRFGVANAVAKAEEYYHKKYLVPMEAFNQGYAAAVAAAQRAALLVQDQPEPAALAATDAVASSAANAAANAAPPAAPEELPWWATDTSSWWSADAGSHAPPEPSVPPPLPPPASPPSAPMADDAGWARSDWSDWSEQEWKDWKEWTPSTSQSSSWQKPAQKKQRKELPQDPQEYVKHCYAKATEWTSAKNRTGWLNKTTPLVYHLLKDTQKDYEVAMKIAADYSGDKLIENMIHLYGKHLKD